MARKAILSIGFALFAAVPAHALCSGATVDQEFRDADVVARVRVRAETNFMDDAPSATNRARWGDSGSVVFYRLTVLERLKGRPGGPILR